MRRAHPGVALGSLALALFAGAAGYRSFPDTAPNDPDYDRWERGVDSSSFYDEQWNLYSFTPRGVALARQASGISADLAWRISTGRRDVTVAILDSGIRWDERELVNQLYLNRGELPEPQDAQGRSTPGAYDLNGDGVFNIQDYAADRRFWDVNGNGILDPGDLIALASDGVDSDGNGYVDDILWMGLLRAGQRPFRRHALRSRDRPREGSGRRGQRRHRRDRGRSPCVPAPGEDRRQLRRGRERLGPGRPLRGQHSGCANFGPHIELAVPSKSCSSGATGIAGGAAALIVSRGKDLVDQGRLSAPLTADEVKQIATLSADDVFDERAEHNPRLYPSQPGWDQYFGYGRLNARAALDRVAPGAIPPEADLRGPDWYETLDPVKTPAIEISGRVAARRAGSYRYIVDYGVGVEPREEAFVPIRVSGPCTAPRSGRLASWNIRSFLPFARRIPAAPNDFTVTLRLRVVDDHGRTAEDRHTVFIHHDRDLHPGFPLALGASGESSPALADLDGDGAAEIIVATADGMVAAIRGDGTMLPGWPVFTDLIPSLDPEAPHNYLEAPAYREGGVGPAHGSIIVSVAVGDVDGSGRPQVVAADLEGKVYVWDRTGRRLPGFPVSTNPEFSRPVDRGPKNVVDHGIAGAPALGDLDGDGVLDIVVGAMDQHLYAWKGDGTAVPGWPVLVRDANAAEPVGARIVSSPAVGDLGGDGSLDVVVGTNEIYGTSGRLYAFRSNGALRPGWPVRVPSFDPEGPEVLPLVGEGVPSAPALADVDGDGKLEVGIAAVAGPVAATGDYMPSFPVPVEDFQFFISPAIADLDGDGRPELITGTGGYLVHAFDHLGREPGGWPKFTGHWLAASAAVGDVDGDGKLEVVINSREGMLFVWDTKGPVQVGGRSALQWPKFHHDLRNSGNFNCECGALRFALHFVERTASE